MDYRKDTAYVVGGGARVPSAVDGNGNPVYEPQLYTQSQLNNNMSGTDANAIYAATHRQDYNPNEPGMMRYQLDLARAGLTPYTGQQVPDDSAPGYLTGGGGAYVTGAGAFTMPNSYDYEAVLPQGMGSFEGLPMNAIPNGDAQSQYYAAILDALTRGRGASPAVQNEIRKEIATSRYA